MKLSKYKLMAASEYFFHSSGLHQEVLPSMSTFPEQLRYIKYVKSCELSTHIIENHPTVDPNSIIKICLVDKAENEVELAILEDQWRWKLMTWAPHGLNVKND